MSALDPDWVSVQLASASSGEILFDLRRTFGTRLGESRAKAIAQDDAGRGRGARGKRLSVRRGRARRAGARRGLFADRLAVGAAICLALLPPANGRYAVSSVVTDEGTFVSRSLAQSERVGTLGSKYLRDAVAGRRSSGTYHKQ